MLMNAKAIAEKAASEQDFLVSLIENPSLTLKRYNTEASDEDLAQIEAAMSKIRDQITESLSQLGLETIRTAWGIGCGCCNSRA